MSWTLLNADGSVFKVVQFSPFESLTLKSPNFQDAFYSSSPWPTQYADAVQRAEFYQTLDDGPWHTMLTPTVVNRVNITVPFYVNVQLSNGNIIQARTYFTGTAADGNTFVLMLNLLFNFFFDNEVVNEINLGNFKNTAMNMVATPNTFLFSLNVNNPNVPRRMLCAGLPHLLLRPGPGAATALARPVRELDLTRTVRSRLPGRDRDVARDPGDPQQPVP